MKNRRVSSIALAFIILLVMLSLPVDVASQQVVYYEDFEDGQAQDWNLDPSWQVIRVDGNYVLSGEGHFWAKFPGQFDDYRLSMRLMLRNGTLHVNYRMNDTGRYFIGVEQGGSYLNKQYFPNTFLNDLAGSQQFHQKNEWHQVEINGKGNQLTFTFDGKVEWTYTDPDPLLSGSFAFETLDDSSVYIDDLKVESVSTSSGTTAGVSTSPLTWIRTGGPLGGLGYDIRMKPGNPDSMLVTDAWAGIFASRDGGLNWSPSSSGINARVGGTADGIPVFCLTFDPKNPNIVWAGTQNIRGIFKSTDGGASWNELDYGIVERNGITFRGFSIDPTNSDIVYAAAELSSWVDGKPERLGREFDMTRGVVYKTTDGGRRWVPVWYGNNLARYIWIDPRDTKVVYVSTGIFDREAANSNPETGDPGGEGIIKSVDGGKTWNHINTGLGNLYVGTLFMHPTNPDILIAGTGNNQYWQNSGVYLTTDGGATWTRTLMPVENENINSVEISTSDPDIIYAASSSTVYRSEDGGHTWKTVSGGFSSGWGPPGIRAGFPIDLQVDPRNPNRIFANDYGGGNFLSEDGGRVWVDSSRGYTGAQVRAIAVDPRQPGRVFATARSGIFASNDGGTNWSGLSYPPVFSLEWNAVAIDPSNPQNILSETNWNNYLVSSSNGGLDWRIVKDFIDQRVGWHAIAFAPSEPDFVYAGSTGYFSAGSFDTDQPGMGIYVSSDGGITWSPANDILSADASVQSLAVDPKDPQVVYAATSNHGLLKTTDGGQNWQAIHGGLPSTAVMSVAIDPANADIIFAGFELQAIYRSLDGGQTWEPAARGMSYESRILSICFDLTNPDVIYAADFFSGVYRSTDGGDHWSTINDGLFMRSVNALAVSGDGLHVYAATEGAGVYRLDINGLPPPPAPAAAAVLSPTLPAAVVPPTSPAITGAAPNSEPGLKLPVCGSSLILPVIFLAMAWLRKRNP